MPLNRTPLQPFITPATIVVFGASPRPGSIGQALLQNLRGGGFAGRLQLISDRHREIDGIPCYAAPDNVGGPLTLALIATPAASVPGIIDICAAAGIRAAIIYSSGLRESDPLSAEHGRRLREAAARGRVRLFGPKALGFVLPHSRLNLTPIAKNVPAGNLALVSQSAAVCTHIFDWSNNDEFGFSAVFSPGESADIEFPEILDYLAHDAKTESILLYLEGLRDARAFLSAVRAAATIKPVIALKAGCQPFSAAIAEAHSGALVGRDDAFDAALRRAGVLRVRAIGDMFSAARALTTPRMPRGNRLAIVANGGGPPLMAADHAAELHIEMAELSAPTRDRLAALLPPGWSSGNPVDTGFLAGPEQIVGAVGACLDDPGVDGVLVILAPNTLVDPLAVADRMIAAMADAGKPVLTCWLGEVQARASRTAFARARLPTFRTPENAVLAYAFMFNWVRNQALLLETPAALSSYVAPDGETARRIIARALDQGRRELLPAERQALLSAFRIPVGDVTAASADRNRARELSIAIRHDRVFGPVISLSEGGVAAEIYDARSIALPPLNPRLVSEMLGVPYVRRLLGPLRGMPAVAQAPLIDILLRVSEMASELPSIHSLDLVSLFADSHGAVVGDARIEIQGVPETRARYGHMAICPYPAQWVSECTLKNGRSCTIRPIRPEDAVMLQDFVRHLSNRSKRFRFFGAVRELSQYQLAHDTQIDYGRELTLVATGDGDDGARISGEAHYAMLLDGESCDFAIVIADDLAGQGLGKRLMQSLIAAAGEQGLRTMRGQVLDDNEPMLALMEALGFDIRLTDDEGVLEVTRQL